MTRASGIGVSLPTRDILRGLDRLNKDAPHQQNQRGRRRDLANKPGDDGHALAEQHARSAQQRYQQQDDDLPKVELVSHRINIVC